MNLTIDIESPQQSFLPGDSLGGAVAGDEELRANDFLSTRLIWFTSGKGDRDFEIVQKLDKSLEGSGPVRIEFDFPLPNRPLSVSGTLISIDWAIEAVAFPSQLTARFPFVLSYGLRPIPLDDKSETLKSLGMSRPKFRLRNP